MLDISNSFTIEDTNQDELPSPEELTHEEMVKLSDDTTGTSTYEDILTIVGYDKELENISLEADSLDALLIKNSEFYETIQIADNEVKVNGTITNETATLLGQRYNDMLSLLEVDLPTISTESAVSFKKELHFLTRENGTGESWVKRLIRKFISFCKSVYYRIVEYSTKLGIAITRQEVAASKLASYISNNLDNFKVDKWEYMIPYADIIGNFTILKDFNRNSIEQYIKFNNGGFRSDELVKLFMRCVDSEDMLRFKKLEDITIDYDMRSYFSRYDKAVVIPIDVSGATGHCLLSYNDNGKTVLERKRFSIIADSKFRSSLKTKGILSREDMVSILRQINISVRENRRNIDRIYEHIRGINNLVNGLNDGDGSRFITDVLQCGTILVHSLSISSRVGLFSNGFIIGVIGKMAKVYKKQSKIKN